MSQEELTNAREINTKTTNIDIKIVKGDITQRNVDAIVNAAHEDLTGGGGVDGAIHRAAGAGLLGECLNLYGCPTGEARITNGWNLLAKYVIHTVGPVWSQDKTKHEDLVSQLSNCYRNCLSIAELQGLKSISFPCISTGAYCFPKEFAALVAIHSIYKWINDYMSYPGNKNGTYLDLIEIVCFTDEDVKFYEKAIKSEENSMKRPTFLYPPADKDNEPVQEGI